MALTEAFDSARSNFVLNATQVALAQKEVENSPTNERGTSNNEKLPLFIPEDEDQNGDDITAGGRDTPASEPHDEPMLIDDADIALLTREAPTTSSPSDELRLVEKRQRTVSPDPVSDGEARPSKKSSIARPLSPSPPPAVAPSIPAFQRLAGPGRTPARVEQILSTNTDGTRRAVQMVLDTSGASWNLKPGQEGPPRKRPLPVDISGSSSGKSARVNMRARLAGFARDGARAVQDSGNEDESDSPEEEEGAKLKVVDEERSSSSKRVERDADDDHEISGDLGQPSTDVVDETMDVDTPENEDAPMKLPNDMSRAATSAGSPTPPRTDDSDLTSHEELVLDSLSDDAPSSSVVAATPSSPLDVPAMRTEVVRTIVGDAPPLAFDLERTTNAWSAYLERKSTLQTLQPAPRSSDLERADLKADDENATAALARVLSKADFDLMDVVGQFNRGFIVARLCKSDAEGTTDDLFIIDQHASDEKYNFETLQATSRLESQRLFACVTTLLACPRREARI